MVIAQRFGAINVRAYEAVRGALREHCRRLWGETRPLRLEFPTKEAGYLPFPRFACIEAMMVVR